MRCLTYWWRKIWSSIPCFVDKEFFLKFICFKKTSVSWPCYLTYLCFYSREFYSTHKAVSSLKIPLGSCRCSVLTQSPALSLFVVSRQFLALPVNHTVNTVTFWNQRHFPDLNLCLWFCGHLGRGFCLSCLRPSPPTSLLPHMIVRRCKWSLVCCTHRCKVRKYT